MNKIYVAFVLTLLLIGFVSADKLNFEEENEVENIQTFTEKEEYKFAVDLHTPSNGDKFDEGEFIEFYFDIEKKGRAIVNIIGCNIYFDNLNEMRIINMDAVLSENKGYVFSNLNGGDYETYVVCRDEKGISWISNIVDFVVNEEITLTETNAPTENLDDSGSNSDEGGGCVTTWVCDDWSSCTNDGEQTRSCYKPEGEEKCFARLSEKPVEIQTCTPEAQLLSSDRSSSNLVNKITGAVVGVAGQKGTLSVGVFLVILGLTSLGVYRRRYLKS